ncbi:hypothetical protein [Kribbella deserti]|uniref:PCRF domain-containing protein n=1 Tax=Kribbella deserti TaxID=1926257 RepID=A0ABV6QF35_9ACTN
MSLEHPPTVYLREDRLAAKINEWIGTLFSAQNLDETVAILVGSQDGADPTEAAERGFRQRIEAAKATIGRLQRALEAGWDPETLTAQYNAAVAEQKSAEADLEALEPAERLTTQEMRAIVDELGNIQRVLAEADREDLAELYRGLRLAVTYDHKENRADVSISPEPHVVKLCVRGGT